MKVNLFTPPSYKFAGLDIDGLNRVTNKKFKYCAKGRYSIYHILQSFSAYGKIMLPIYSCDSISYVVKTLLHMEVVYYDLELEDLNASLDAIKTAYEKSKAKYLLVASLYGNPADLVNIEKFCADNEIFLLDDAAQSFGATINGKYVGTFGNAGFLAFSPGKATVAHMGSFFWTQNTDYLFYQTRHTLCHLLVYINFYINRVKTYTLGRFKFFSVLSRISELIITKVDMKNDAIAGFERRILGGVLKAQLNETFTFRNNYFKEFKHIFGSNKLFKIITAQRGIPCNHKIVLLFNDNELCNEFKKFLSKSEICYYGGYALPNVNYDCPNAQYVNGKIVELPIEDNNDRMSYIFQIVRLFIEENKNYES